MLPIPDIILIPRGGSTLKAIEVLKASHCYDVCTFLLPSTLGDGRAFQGSGCGQRMPTALFLCLEMLHSWQQLFSTLYQFGWIIM